MVDDPVEILVKMAERGEIDPWNIDIIEVTDRFFAEMEKQQALDLRLSARTLLYAATLLRMKSEYLTNPGWENMEEEEEGDGDTEFPEENDYSSINNPIQVLEYEISRRLGRKSMRKQPITLYDLINLLRNAEKEERRRQREVWRYEDYCYVDDVISIAHEEAYQENAREVLSCCADCFTTCNRIPLSELAERLTWSPVHVFIPLLFLMYEGHVELYQDACYGEVYVVPIQRNGAVISDHARIGVL